MPADFVIDADRRLVLSRAWGILTDNDLLTHQHRLRTHPAFDPGFNQLFDFREVTDAEVTPGGVHLLARRNAFGQDARRAFIVRSQLLYGMMRMFEILTSDDPDELRVECEDPEAARRWLGLDDTPMPDLTVRS